MALKKDRGSAVRLLLATAALAGAWVGPVRAPAGETRPIFSPDAPRHTVRQVYKRVAGRDLAIYLYLPKDWNQEDTRAAIVYFSGGTWRWSGPGQFIRHCKYLSSRGMVAAAAHFRVGQAPPFTPAWSVEDAKSAVRWLRQHAGRWGIHPERIVTAGYSSGAHMAACTAMTDGFEGSGEDLSISPAPNAMVLINPVMRFGEHLRNSRKMPGLSEEDMDRLEPNRGLRKGLPPAFIVYGRQDFLLPGGMEFIEKSQALHNTVDAMLVDGKGHGFAKASPWHERVMARVDRFLASLGYLEGPPTIRIPAESPKVTPKPALVISPGILLESWEDGGSLPWAAWDSSVVLAGVTRASHGRWGARLTFDFARCQWPVMFHRPEGTWDLRQVSTILVDVYAAGDVAGKVGVAFRLGHGRDKYAAPRKMLKAGWNEVTANLEADWLPAAVRAAATDLSWVLSTAQPGLAGQVVFDHLRTE